jgi:hypothetical protein
MQDYYRINVAKNGKYLFATEQGRLTSRSQAEEVIKLFKEKFTTEEGYKVTCIRWEYRGEEVVL